VRYERSRWVSGLSVLGEGSDDEDVDEIGLHLNVVEDPGSVALEIVVWIATEGFGPCRVFCEKSIWLVGFTWGLLDVAYVYTYSKRLVGPWFDVILIGRS
jgi:hypothetical protein